jgi:TPR repeat protein
MLHAQAELGNTDAYFLLGAVYASDQYAQQDYTLAANWFRMAAEQGDSNAQFNLGVMYEFGNGVNEDTNRAIGWYYLAAQQGHPDAISSLRILQGDLLSSKPEGA